jgi:hypothetical protein
MAIGVGPYFRPKQTVGKPQGAANGEREKDCGGYIDAMIASPNSEHLISVAPCIRRAKS